MYFLDIYALANQLRENAITARDEALYFIGVVICAAIMGKVYLLPVGIAIIYLYKINKQGDNKDFLKRSVPLIFTTSLYYLFAFLVLQLALLAPTIMIGGLYGLTEANVLILATYLLYIGFNVGLFISYLSFMGKQMRKISQRPVTIECENCKTTF